MDDREQFKQWMTLNATTLRTEVIRKLLGSRGRDFNWECGYPDTLDIFNYRELYNRWGLAARVVSIWPDESWKLEPSVYQSEKAEESEFEQQVSDLCKKQFWWHYLARADVLSGIGQYGLLLFGLSDGQDLQQPVNGINPDTGELTTPGSHELLYLRAFDESLIEIKSFEPDVTSPRYGLPKLYGIKFENVAGDTTQTQSKLVHWSRVLHLADNRECSEVYGIPRMRNVFNHLLDIRKISGGGAEMFWKGGFPGYNFKVDPKWADETQLDTDTLKEQVRLYSEGLSRYMSLVGISVESLEPQVVDPRGHIESTVKLIAMSIGVPYRLILGTEEAKLASTQDKQTWNERVAKRQRTYLTPLVVRPFIDRLMAYGVLPMVDDYMVDWPDLNTPTDMDIAEVALKRTEAYAKYVQAGVETVIPPKEYHMMVQGMTEDEAQTLEDAADEFQAEVNEMEQEETEPAPVEPEPVAVE